MSDVVLVHGAYGGGFVWQNVSDRLRARGHRVWTPTLTGLGERRHLLTPDVDLDTHIRDVEAVLFCENLHDAVVVAHSYAGMVLAGLDDETAQRIAGVVLLDAAVPNHGEAIHDVYSEVQPNDLPAEIRRLHLRNGPDGLTIPVPEGLRKDPRYAPHPLSTHYARVRRGRCFDPPRSRIYIRCTGWRSINAVAAERARALGFQIWDLATGHSPMQTHPSELVDCLDRAASYAITSTA